MKQACRNFTILALCAALIAPATVLAQKEEKEAKEKEKKEVEHIIITRKGDKNEKLVVEIVGDKITVNGKPVEEFKDAEGEVSVRRSKIRDTWSYTPDAFGGQNVFNAQPFKMLSLDSNRAMLGVTTEKTEQGIEINDISEGSAAEKAGLKEGDIITKVDGKTINDPDELSSVIKKHKPGDKVSITYLRDKKEATTSTELTKWKGTNIFSTMPGQGLKMDLGDMHFDNVLPKARTVPGVRTPYAYSYGGGPKLGLSVQDTDDGKGVKVLEVDEESNAAKAGLKENDLITEINGKAVNSADEVAKIVRENKDKATISVKLSRAGKTQNIEVKIPRKLKTADL